LGNKKYEILNIENINEKNVFLILNCIEVLWLNLILVNL
jgi:hypothetical protein